MRVAVVVLAIAACSPSGSERAAPSPSSAPSLEPVPAETRVRVRTGEASSTIAAADYIGPDACGECHPVQHAQWSASLHRTMNQRAGAREVIAPAATLAYAGGTMTVARDARGATMTLAKGGATKRYRITRTIGTRHLQEYVGVDERDLAGGVEVRLPFAWWPRGAGWFPQPYFDPWFAREEDFDAYAALSPTEPVEPWAERCPWCHSTYPFALRVARAQTRNVGHGFEQFFASASASGAPSPASPDRLAVEAQVSTGISCESCHLGGRAHRDGAPIHLVPIGAPLREGAAGPVPTTFTAERADPAIVNRVCAQCHSGPSPRLADGTSLRNSSEALDLAASTCAARCTDCHDPHTGGASEARAIAACITCHAPFAGSAHAGHAAETTCLDCHMPKMVMGIDRVVRTHRVSSPTNEKVLAAAGPNACNLCHVDRSMQWTLDELARGWSVTLARSAAAAPRAWAAYGDLEAPVGEVWLASKEPALRLLAADALARSNLASLSRPRLLDRLSDPLPHLRAWTWFAVQTAMKLPASAFDPRAPVAQRRVQIERLRTRVASPGSR